MKEKYISPLPDRFRGFLIDKYCGGKKIYYSFNVKTRYELIKGAVNDFKREFYTKFGGRKGYDENFARELGFKSYMEYRKELIKALGYENFTDYNNKKAIEKGYKGQYEKNKDRIMKLGFKTLYQYYKSLALKKGKSSVRDYNKSLKKYRKEKENKK